MELYRGFKTKKNRAEQKAKQRKAELYRIEKKRMKERKSNDCFSIRLYSILQ